MNIFEELQNLHEDYNLYRGIFWIVDLDDLYNNRNYCFQIPCDQYGFKTEDEYYNSKNGNTYNHEATWKMLSNKLTHNKPYNYYPRGRVEIMNGKATIYLNPNINTEDVKNFIVDQFNLVPHNGIKKVRVIPDFSAHYKCHLD